MEAREGEWYLDYLADWHPYVDGKNVFLVYFEDMKKVVRNVL